MLNALLATPQAAEPQRVALDEVQVLEDLEALVKLLSSRTSDAEHTASSLQKKVKTLHAAADQSGQDQAACKLQLDTLKKEAGAAKQVLALVASLCTSACQQACLNPTQRLMSHWKECRHLLAQTHLSKHKLAAKHIFAFLHSVANCKLLLL